MSSQVLLVCHIGSRGLGEVSVIYIFFSYKKVIVADLNFEIKVHQSQCEEQFSFKLKYLKYAIERDQRWTIRYMYVESKIKVQIDAWYHWKRVAFTCNWVKFTVFTYIF